MNILEFELRVKQHAYSSNKGFVNTFQLIEAFKDTSIFRSLIDRDSNEYKFLVSPFVAHFPIGSTLVDEQKSVL